MKNDKVILELRNLKKYYGKIRGVEDVSLKLQKGEVYGFIGPNGAGKSTTLRAIMNLINKTSGNIYINGKEIDKNDMALKETIGYLPSEINLYDDLNVKQMLDFHSCFYNKDLSKRRNELVKLLRLDETKKIGFNEVRITFSKENEPMIKIAHDNGGKQISSDEDSIKYEFSL